MAFTHKLTAQDLQTIFFVFITGTTLIRLSICAFLPRLDSRRMEKVPKLQYNKYLLVQHHSESLSGVLQQPYCL